MENNNNSNINININNAETRQDAKEDKPGKKWYEKGSVIAGLIGAAAVIIAALIALPGGGNITNISPVITNNSEDTNRIKDTQENKKETSVSNQADNNSGTVIQGNGNQIGSISNENSK